MWGPLAKWDTANTTKTFQEGYLLHFWRPSSSKNRFFKLYCNIFTELKLHDKFRDGVLYPLSHLPFSSQTPVGLHGVTEYPKRKPLWISRKQQTAGF